jgi:hypothetical protein
MAKLVVFALLGTVALTLSGAARPGASRVASCPRSALPLTGANPIAPATRAVLQRVSSGSRPQVQAASIAWSDPTRGGEVKRQCGASTARRTVIVYVLGRATLPSQSLSQGVYFVARFATGYRVWEVAH